VIGFIIGLNFYLRKKSRREDPVLSAYRKFCLRMEARGHGRAPHEGPHAYFDRLRLKSAAHADELKRLEDDFTSLRYGPPLDPTESRARMKSLRTTSRHLSRTM
jgi:hypothetical protein